jgi:hypothetical protein
MGNEEEANNYILEKCVLWPKAIDWDKLSSSQVIIVQSILAAAELKVATDIDRGILMADTVTSVREVIQWIDEAARLHKK